MRILTTYQAQVRTRGSREHDFPGARASSPRAVHAGKMPALPGRQRPRKAGGPAKPPFPT